jgi:hypothetical protein
MTRYLSGLCVAGLGLCGGGCLIVAAMASGGEFAGLAGQVNLLTGAGLVVVSCVSLGCWATAWRRRMRSDGVLSERFLIVTRRQARRNRRELRRDVGRTTRLAKRSAREARRAARRAARLAGAGGGVLSAGAGLGSALGGDGPYSVTVPAAPAPRPAMATVPAGQAVQAGESAAELLSELRAMLVPLLTATEERPAAAPAPAASPSESPSPSPLPRRIPGPASPVPPLTVPPLTVPIAVPPAAPPVDGDELMFAADGEEAWW